ncbi:LuxR C-terminal-related transcriptional regulator [Plesiomonas shigelloides]|uniref:LuxR C-terminal-related transcriptional regulator n=1 Tax=Plesiomonas shigelloides TaxID=703 RepID=UPI0022459BA1|nr:LuxR C-terminal-related transcriptional regulator [Plesiomonas shigelloides]MCX2499461.1 LuxR C-terminal-related transcriptional regulator [Plesiomonas shigelloides]
MKKSMHLLLITKPSLQASALSRALSEKTTLTVSIHNLANPLETLPADLTLMLFDLSKMNIREAKIWQYRISKHRNNIKTLLFNVPLSIEPEDILLWPTISGVFHDIDNENTLIKGINSIIGGELWLSRSLCGLLIEHLRHNQPALVNYPKLTIREREVLEQLRSGASNMDIACMLFVSEHTVKAHIYNLFRKINVRNRTQALKWATENIKR